MLWRVFFLPRLCQVLKGGVVHRLSLLSRVSFVWRIFRYGRKPVPVLTYLHSAGMHEGILPFLDHQLESYLPQPQCITQAAKVTCRNQSKQKKKLSLTVTRNCPLSHAGAVKECTQNWRAQFWGTPKVAASNVSCFSKECIQAILVPLTLSAETV